MMELSLKSKSIKKRHKKKRINVPKSALVPLIKPEGPDGDCNWMRMQKIIGSVKGESFKKDIERKMITTTAMNLKSKDYKPPFSQKARHNTKISSQSSQDKCYNINNKSSVNQSLREHSKISSSGQQELFESKFNESIKNSPAKNNSGHKTTKDEISNRIAEKKLTKAVAMDCEMVGTGPKGDDSIIARVSIVNSYGDCLYDEFVKPKERVTDFRTKISGVRPSDLKKGKDLFEVQRDVLYIIEGRILVGHSIKHDLDVLFISHPRQLIRDTAFYKPFRDICGGRTPALKKLTSRILGCEIQSGEHSSVEDAQAAMLLYLRQRREWESLIKSERKRKPKIIENQTKC